MKEWNGQYSFDISNAKEYFTEHGVRCLQLEREQFLQHVFPLTNGIHTFLSCNLLCRTRSWRGNWYRRINPDFLNLSYVHTGETQVRINDRFFTAEAGEVILLRPGNDYELGVEHACERSGVIVVGCLLDSFMAVPGLRERDVFTPPEKDFRSLLDELFLACSDNSDTGVRKASCLLFDIFQILMLPPAKSSLPHVVEVAVREMKNRYDKPFSVEELARELGVSPSLLTQKFKRALHQTPYQYIRRLRMEQALKILRGHQFSVKETALAVGYDNPFNFSTEFRKFYGKSPRNLL